MGHIKVLGIFVNKNKCVNLLFELPYLSYWKYQMFFLITFITCQTFKVQSQFQACLISELETAHLPQYVCFEFRIASLHSVNSI